MRSKHVITGLLILFGLNFSFTQEKEKGRARDKFIFDINYNSWLNPPQEFEQLPWKSVGVGFNFYKDIPLGYSSHSFAWGLAYTVDKVHSNIYLSPRRDPANSSIPNYSVIDVNQNAEMYNRNKFVTHYLELPLELRLRTKGLSTFHTHIGFKGGLLVNNFSRTIENGYKVKKYNIPEINRFRYGPTFRIGYSHLNFYAYYNMAGLFKNNTQTFVPFTIGISYIRGRGGYL